MEILRLVKINNDNFTQRINDFRDDWENKGLDIEIKKGRNHNIATPQFIQMLNSQVGFRHNEIDLIATGLRRYLAYENRWVNKGYSSRALKYVDLVPNDNIFGVKDRFGFLSVRPVSAKNNVNLKNESDGIIAELINSSSVFSNNNLGQLDIFPSNPHISLFFIKNFKNKSSILEELVDDFSIKFSRLHANYSPVKLLGYGINADNLRKICKQFGREII